MARPPLTGVSEQLFRQQLIAALDDIDTRIAAVLPDGDKGDITVSGSGVTWNIDASAVGATELASNAVETAKILDGAVTFAKLADAAVITSTETIAANDSDTAIPTAAAVLDIVGPQLQTAVTAAAQTAIDFTGIPSWVNRVTVIFAGLSTNGTSNVLVQIGDSGGIENTGYLSTQGAMDGGAVGTTSATNGFHLTPSAATNVISGAMTLSRQTGNTWVASGLVKRSVTAVLFPSGDKTLSATLDRVRLTMANGIDTFDAGSVSISWE